MPDINDEMKITADYAIKTSRERYKLELDFSEQSIAQLDKILERIHWGFSGQSKDRAEGGLIYQTALIWGSFLGEYMRRKWGGTWIVKGKDRLLSIINIEVSPISLVYAKITTHPEYTVKNYLIETKRIIENTPLISPQPPQYLSENVGQPTEKIPGERSKKTKKFDKRILIPIVSFEAILLVIIAWIGMYMITRTSDISAFGFHKPATNTSTIIPIVETLFTATHSSTNTQYPTVTPLPTYTSSPTFTPRPSYTPSQTYTQIATLTPTETETPIIPTRTYTRVPPPTPVPENPTNPPVPPTEIPQPTATEIPQPTETEIPQPTVTQPAPVVIDSCDVNPSTVPVGINVTITFIVHFSSPGYGFDAEVGNDYPGQGGCSGADGDGDGVAYCDGSSGELPASTSVNVTLSSSVGDCVVGYSSR